MCLPLTRMFVAFSICLVNIAGIDYQQLGGLVTMPSSSALPIYDAIVIRYCLSSLLSPLFKLQFELSIIKRTV